MGLQLLITEEDCTGCGNCVEACPVSVSMEMESISSGEKPKEKSLLQVEDGLVELLDEERCDFCGVCIEACPTGAISIREE